jgi:dipeptidyl aminopeptidase/acylaminoacyl peptidase
MKKITLLTIFFISFTILANDNFTSEKLMNLKRIGDISLSPDGSTLVFTVSQPDIEENSSVTDIYSLNLSSGVLNQLTQSGEHNYNPVWHQGSKKIIFLSDREETPQVFIMNLSIGGDPEIVTDFENGIANVNISPLGSYFSFTSEIKLDSAYGDLNTDLDKAKAYIYDDLPARHWDQWIDEKYSHLFIMPFEEGDPVDINRGERFDIPLKPFGGREQIAWSPDEKEIAYTSKKVKDFVTSTNSDIYIYNLALKETINITSSNPGYDMEPLYSPDGNYIAYHSQERPGYESDKTRLLIFDRKSKTSNDLTKNFPQSAGKFCWSPDSKSLYFSAVDTGKAKIFSVDLKGNVKIIKQGMANYGDKALLVTKDGKSIISSKRDFNRPEELYIINTQSPQEEKQLTDINAEFYEGVKPVKFQERWSKSTDGANVHSWVIYPPNFDPKKKYPVITYCQGGPQQAVSCFWSYGWNFLTMASEGYIVIATNRRGCPGFGQDWVDAIIKDYSGKPMDDIVTAVDDLAKEPYVDKNRIAAIGGSAGGYATFWLAGNNSSGRFKAFISHCGLFDMISEFGSTEELWFPNNDNGGPYWQGNNIDYYNKISPHMYVKNWKDPILIITGMLDFRVPYTQSLEAFTAARAQGVPARIVVFPEENHWVLKPQEQILWYREFFGFLSKYL